VTKFKRLLEATKIHRSDNAEEQAVLEWVPPRRGRPTGKRSHPDFEQNHSLYPQRHPSRRQDRVVE
jgi:hypothetical protein